MSEYDPADDIIVLCPGDPYYMGLDELEELAENYKKLQAGYNELENLVNDYKNELNKARNEFKNFVTNSKELALKRKRTYIILIYALLEKLNIDPKTSKATGQIREILNNVNLSLDDDTITSLKKEICRFVNENKE